MKKLTTAQVKDLPDLLDVHSVQTIATYYNVHPQTINRWIKILRSKGYPIRLKAGPRPLLD